MVAPPRISYSVVKLSNVFNVIRITPNSEQFVCTTDDYAKALLIVDLLGAREEYDRQKEIPTNYVPWNSRNYNT